jgi:hypothetical protein
MHLGPTSFASQINGSPRTNFCMNYLKAREKLQVFVGENVSLLFILCI